MFVVNDRSTLLPVIGLVQAGQQAMADRFTYFPAIGLCIVVAWGGREWVRAPAWRIGLATAVLVVFAVASWSQARVWRDSIALYEQALSAAPPNPVIRTYLARVHLSAGRVDEAIAHYRRTLEVPGYALPGHFNLGYALEHHGRTARAVQHYRRALALANARGEEEFARRVRRRLTEAAKSK